MNTAVIVCHDSMPGPPHETLRDYLLERGVTHLLFIGHVNQYVKGNPIRSSYCKIYVSKTLVTHISAYELHLPEVFMYIHDVLLTFYWVLRYRRSKVDYFFGLANLNMIVGIVLQKFGVINRTIYYVIDYVPQRFSNRFLNLLYHYLDKICAEQANSTWNYGKGMIQAREKRWKKTFSHQLHVPHGVSLDKKTMHTGKIIHPHQLIYLGTLYEQQGLQLIISAMPIIARSIPAIALTVIGIGPYKETLATLAKTKQVFKKITFLGFIEDSAEVDMLLSQAALGIATYKNTMGFVMYTEPGKVKRYLSCGTPVIITEGTPLAEDITHHKCGIVCSYNTEIVATAIIKALHNKKVLLQMRKKAISYVQELTWEKVYTKALDQGL